LGPQGQLIQFKDTTFSYWAHISGKLWVAPAVGMTPKVAGLNAKEWRYCEAVGAHEIEKVSLLISKQMWQEKKDRHVGQKLREMALIKDRQMAARLRGASGFSPQDEAANKKSEARWKMREDEALRLICSEFNPTNRATFLDMELTPESTSPLRNVGAKRQGCA
jgi:hypothetical protein